MKMLGRFPLFALGLVLASAACGGSAPPPASPSTPPPATNADDAGAPPQAGNPAGSAVSVVRFDDLGVSFAVPSGMRVIGDDELAAHIRASASPRVNADLKARAAEGKGLPLLTLVADASAANPLGVTLVVVVVPDDANATELLGHELGILKENLTDFAVTDGPTPKTLDGVVGAEVADAYTLKGPHGQTRARMRIFVRKGRAFLLTAVWSGNAPPEMDLQASALLEGLHFYEPAP